MKTVKFKDNTEIEVLNIIGKMEFVKGFNRDVLEFVFDAENHNTGDLLNLFTDTFKTEQITIIDGLEEYVYMDYIIPSQTYIALTEEVTTPETSETPAVYERRIKVELAQQTYLEKSINAQQAQLLATQEALDFLIIGGM